MFSVLVALILAVVSLYAYWYFNYKTRYAHLPGTPPTFLLGNLGWVLRMYSKALPLHPGVYILDRIMGDIFLHRKTGLHCFWFGLEPIVTIYKAEVLEEILGNNVSLEKSYEYKFLHNWLGQGLLTSTGSKWRYRRKLLTPAFHFRILEDFLPIFNEQSLVLVRKFKSLHEAEYIDITPLVILCTLDIVCETVMGVHIGAQAGENSEYVTAVHNLADFFNKRTVKPWQWPDFWYGISSTGKAYYKDLNTVHGFTQRVIKEKKESILSASSIEASDAKVDDEFHSKKRKTFMDLLLHMHLEGQNLSEEDIREEVDTFMFEGHDTTAMGIIFALYCIGLYPDVQKRVVEEVDAIFSSDVERYVTHDDIRSMKYLECTLKESQRLFPSVPIIGRKLKEDLTHNETTIPGGTTLHFNIIGLHRDAGVFPNPDVFDPDRFLPENVNRHPYAYVPFSAGPRNCIGQKFAMMEEKVVIANILRHFAVTSLDPRDKMQTKIEFTLKPAQPMRLKFALR